MLHGYSPIKAAGADMYERSDSDSSNTIVDTDSKLNENEATLVISHINKLISLGIPEESIAIISPYNGQVGLLSLELRDRFPGLEIGSVDGFQVCARVPRTRHGGRSFGVV